MSNMSFDVELAVEIGLPEALLLQNINFWVCKNAANEKAIYEGCAWTYNSIKAFHELFPFISAGIIRCKLNWLEDNGYIRTGNYNKSAYDRTKWYTVTAKAKLLLNKAKLQIADTLHPNANEEIPIGDTVNGTAASINGSMSVDEPIPDIKPDIITDKETDIYTASKPDTNAGAREGVQRERFEKFWQSYPKKQGKGAAEKAWRRIKPDKLLLAKILCAVDEAKHSHQWQRDNGQYIPHPATWLNQKRWEDEIFAGTGNANPQIAMAARAMELIENEY